MLKLYSLKIDNPVRKLKKNGKYYNLTKTLENIGTFDKKVKINSVNDDELYVIDNKDDKYSFTVSKLDYSSDIITKKCDDKEIIYKYSRNKSLFEYYYILTTFKMNDNISFALKKEYDEYTYSLIQHQVNPKQRYEIDVSISPQDELNEIQEQLLVNKINTFFKHHSKMTLLQFHNIYMDIKPLTERTFREFSSYCGNYFDNSIFYLDKELIRTTLAYSSEFKQKVEKEIIEPEEKTMEPEKTKDKCKIIRLFN